ncbi:PAS domain S-box protein [Halostella litorea]|uniref:PAS domain S-box protein n=1 Tax=Halostella litorea TaxID=2528831 RepID=UPI0010923739|nr:PAS domain S-box protein [Halostella litorea]
MSTQDPSPVNEALLHLNGTDPITVLHVDDDPDFADLVSVYLERENSSLEVITETSADAGLDRLADVDIDCIVSDYDMPRTDGLEFLSAVREEYPQVPFILFTGKGSEEIASDAISAGVTDYLQKGGGTDQYTVLENRISNAVRQYQAEREIDRGFQALETAREGISLLDEEGTFLYVNQAYADTYGYDRSELIGEHWETIYPEDHVTQVYEEILPAVSEEGQWEGEHTHRTKDGERLVVDHALAYAESGSIICLVRDVTDEKETQRILEEERRRFELFVDAVEEYAIFALDADGYVTSWNRGAERIKGYAPEEILGEHVSTFHTEKQADAGSPDELLEQALEDGWVTDEGWRVREGGSRFWADVTITAVFDGNGRHRGYVKVTQDVTDRLDTRDEPDGDRQFIDQALDVLDDVFYVLDPDGSISRVTQRAIEVTGYTEAELRSMDLVELFPEDQRARVQSDIEDAIATGSAELEVDVLTKDGRTIPYEFRKRRITDEDGDVVGAVGIGRDITKRKRRERQLQRQLDQFERFGSILSHDLRTPLQTVTGRIDLARETGETEHLDKAEAALGRLEMLIDDLSTVMREGELVDDVTALDVEASVRDVWEALPTDGVSLRVRETARIRADENAFARLLENLLKNALDHGEGTVTVGVLSDGFYLEDDGPGVPEDIREEIFELGYSTKLSDDGTGFGLASARQIAVAHGWEITATEGDDGGARFEVTDVEMA